MTKKAKQYSSEEKTKVAIEAIKGELTIAQISSNHYRDWIKKKSSLFA